MLKIQAGQGREEEQPCRGYLADSLASAHDGTFFFFLI